MSAIETRKCKPCQRILPLEAFSQGNLRSQCYRCRDCEREKAKKDRTAPDYQARATAAAKRWREKHPETVKEYKQTYRERALENTRKYKANNPLSALLGYSRDSARKRKLEHTITLEDLQRQYELQDGKCYWFGIPLALDGSHANTPNRVSLDRLDSSRGYNPDNIVLTSQAANFGKHDYSVETWKKFIGDIKLAFTQQYDI